MGIRGNSSTSKGMWAANVKVKTIQARPGPEKGSGFLGVEMIGYPSDATLAPVGSPLKRGLAPNKNIATI